ncbi:hypothetical protein AY599_09340 [Leptolyngbya valderiana BDU 20041]|nr:hypothetical protein AY599_09340 [Leptolyngbya valderiana BDU 20041]
MKRLKGDLDRWIEKGLVPAQHRQAILDDVAPARAGWSASGAVAILGAVLLAFAAVSFVAANWDAIPRIGRFAVILAALWASLLGSGAAFSRNNSALGHALAVLGAALFGAAIALTAQTFNISAFRNTGVLIWAGAALVTAAILPSRPVLILAALLGAFWAGAEAANPLTPAHVWSYGPLWLVTAALGWRMKSAVTLNLLGLAGLVWGGHLLFETTQGTLGDAHRFAVYAVINGALAMGFAALRDRAVFGAGIPAAWFGAAALAAGFALQSGSQTAAAAPTLYLALTGAALAALSVAAMARAATRAIGWTSAVGLVAAGLAAAALPVIHASIGDGAAFAVEVGAGAAVYAAATALILIGATPGRRAAGVLGVLLFIAQTLYVYGVLFGGLLGTAVFFALGGLLLLGLSLVLGRIARRLAVTGSEAS